MAAHTPGPWQADGCLVSFPYRESVAYVRQGANIIAQIWRPEGAEDEATKANAYLIATSPDLRRFAQEIGQLEPQDFDRDMGETLIRRARALVAKADGAT